MGRGDGKGLFSVFAHADELPLFQISFMHIDNVAAAMTEPVGHVFELTLTNCVVHKFQVGGKAIDVRPKWIAVIDRYTTKSKNKSSHEDVSDKDSLLGSSDGREDSRDGDIDDNLDKDTPKNDDPRESLESASSSLDPVGSIPDRKSKVTRHIREKESDESKKQLEKSGKTKLNSSYLSPSSGTEDPADRVNDGNSSGRSSNSAAGPPLRPLKMEMTRINNADTQAGGEVAAVAVAENPAQRREEERVEESEERELMLFRHLFLWHPTSVLCGVAD